jgi:hypothetical protein
MQTEARACFQTPFRFRIQKRRIEVTIDVTSSSTLHHPPDRPGNGKMARRAALQIWLDHDGNLNANAHCLNMLLPVSLLFAQKIEPFPFIEFVVPSTRDRPILIGDVAPIRISSAKRSG